MMRSFRSALVAGLAAACLMACSGNGTTSPVPSKGLPKYHFTYVLAGDTLRIAYGAVRYCRGNSLITDPAGANRDTVPIILSGDSLFMGAGSTSTENSGDSIKWQLYSVLVRQGAGAGLTGLWREIGLISKLLYGHPTAEQQREFERDRVSDKAIPTACPNPQSPEWFDAFLSANVKPPLPDEVLQ